MPQSIQIREITQYIEYNFIEGIFSITQKTNTTNRWSAYYDSSKDVNHPERLVTISNQLTRLKLKGVITFTLSNNNQLIFETKSSAETKAAIQSISDESTDTDYNEKGAVFSTKTMKYISTDYSQGVVPIFMTLVYDFVAP